jgi:gag-polypeptide of LTR copia-type/Zinc knuckle
MEEQSVRMNYGGVPLFDGTQGKFVMWWKKFRAFAYLNGFGEAVQEVPDPDLPSSYFESIDTNTEEGKKKLLAKKKNDLAISSLSIAFSKEGTMGIITRTISEDWPTGQGHMVIKALMKRYRPIDTISKVEMRQKLNKITMKKGSDPTLLFEELSGIEEKYMIPGQKIDESDLIAIVLDVATDDYQVVLTTEQRRRGRELTLSDLEDAMYQHYRQATRNKPDRRVIKEEGEVLLSAFQGTCYSCGKTGHRANQCKNRNKEGK